MLDDLGQLRDGNFVFDQNDADCMEKVPEFKYLAMHVMQAFRRGISKGIDTDLELIRQGKATFLCHSAELKKESDHMKFRYKLVNGNVPPELMNRMHDLLDLGFFEFPAPSAVKDV